MFISIYKSLSVYQSFLVYLSDTGGYGGREEIDIPNMSYEAHSHFQFTCEKEVEDIIHREHFQQLQRFAFLHISDLF